MGLKKQNSKFVVVRLSTGEIPFDLPELPISQTQETRGSEAGFLSVTSEGENYTGGSREGPCFSANLKQEMLFVAHP